MGRYERSAGMAALMSTNQGPDSSSPRTTPDSQSSPTPSIAPAPYDPPDTYNAGDIAMENVFASPLASPDAFTRGDKSGSYMSLNEPLGKHAADNISLLSHRSRHPHTKHFDHNQARKNLFIAGGVKLLVTIFFSALMCFALKAWEGFHEPVVLMIAVFVLLEPPLLLGGGGSCLGRSMARTQLVSDEVLLAHRPARQCHRDICVQCSKS